MARATFSLGRNPIIALFAASLGAGPTGIGFAVAASTITGIFVKMPAGVLSDIIGRKRTLLFSLLLAAFFPFAYLLIHSYEVLIVVRFFHGFATATFNPVAMAVVMELAGNRRAEMISWFTSLTFLGTLIGPPLGGFLLTQFAGVDGPQLAHYHTIYKVVGAMGITTLLAGIWILRSSQESLPISSNSDLSEFGPKFQTGVREILMNRTVLLTSNMVGVLALSIGALEAFLPIYTVFVLGFTPFYAGVLWGVQILMTIAAKPIMGMLSDRHGRTPLLFWGMWVAVIAFILIPWVSSFFFLVLLAGMYGLGRAMVTSSAAALVADVCEKDHLGTAMGSYGTILDVGHAAGPILAGFLIALSGGQNFRLSFAVISIILIIATFAFNTMVKPHHISPQPLPSPSDLDD